MCDQCQTRSIRWKIYNIAFKVIGKTKMWSRIGPKIWN